MKSLVKDFDVAIPDCVSCFCLLWYYSCMQSHFVLVLCLHRVPGKLINGCLLFPQARFNGYKEISMQIKLSKTAKLPSCIIVVQVTMNQQNIIRKIGQEEKDVAMTSETFT